MHSAGLWWVDGRTQRLFLLTFTLLKTNPQQLRQNKKTTHITGAMLIEHKPVENVVLSSFHVKELSISVFFCDKSIPWEATPETVTLLAPDFRSLFQ